MTNVNYAKRTGRLIGVWFLSSLLASVLGGFKNDPGRPPIGFGLAVLIPLAVFGLWFSRSEGFRRFALSLDARALTLTQALRITGYVFLVLYTYRLLPGPFALSAGWGDIIIGASAPLVAMRLSAPGHKSGFIAWQMLGILDLVLAIALGTTTQLIDPQAVSGAAMTVLPLSLIPTFAVPLFLILHIVCIAQARRWSESSIGVERIPAV